MKKFIFMLSIFFVSITSIKALPLPIDVTADSVVVLNQKTNQVIYEKNPDKQEILASLTKIMTAYTVIENVPNLNKKVKITEDDLYNLYGFTCAGLEVGDKVTYLDLLYAMMLPSGADASQALALHTSGSTEAFNKLMNEEAKKLGLRNSNFEDSYGGHDDNVSTAREMARLLKEALKNKTFKKVFTTTTKTLSNGLQVTNYTRSVATFHGLDDTLITGNKSGFTPEAGLLLASTATINDTEYIIIVMKSQVNEYLSSHVLDTYKIINYVSTVEFETRTLIQQDEIIKKIEVQDGTISEYVVTADKTVEVTLPKDSFNNLEIDYQIANKITPENKVGDNLGFVDILVNGEVIETYDIYLKDEIFSYQEETTVPVIAIVILVFISLIILCTNLFSFKKKKF